MKTINLHRSESITVKSLTDLTEGQKQGMAEHFLSKVTVYCQNDIVEYILLKSYDDSEAPFNFDDMENYDYTGDIKISGQWYTLTASEAGEKREFYKHLLEKAENYLEIAKTIYSDDSHKVICKLEEKVGYFESFINDLERFEPENAPEIMQWFFAPELCYHLAKRGEIVLNGVYWGRQSYGQAVCLDRVIQEIAFDLNW